MSRYWLPVVAAAALALLSGCDRVPLSSGFVPATSTAGALVFDAVRSGQSLQVSDIIWSEIYSGQFSGRLGGMRLEQDFGMSPEEIQAISSFADDARLRMREFQRASVTALCASGDSISTRSDAARAHNRMLSDVGLFEKSLILEFFDLLGHARALELVETVHQSRLGSGTPVAAVPDPTVFHLVDDRSPEDFVDSMCATLDE